MFKKVLVSEDHQSSNLSVRKILEDLDVKRCDYVYHCDAALLQIKNALQANDPYDLLITDLSFEDDGTRQQINDGEVLIQEVKKLQPDMKIIVFSAESQTAVINHLMKDLDVSAYVRKARRDVEELSNALRNVRQNKKYLSADLSQSIRAQKSYNFSEYDIVLLKLLSDGMLQKNIPDYLSRNNISPNGLSSVEKKLGAMRNALGFTKNEQLIALCKDLGVI